MSKPRVLVPLAEGFEELEAVAIIDVLRRAGIEVFVASLARGAKSVRGAHGIAVEVDGDLEAAAAQHFDQIALPGGMPGTANLMADTRLLELLRAQHAGGRRVAAICAAPLVLERAGLLRGQSATSFPSVRPALRAAGVEVLDEPRVHRCGRITTSQGAGTAVEFALALVADLVGVSQAETLGRELLARA